MGHRITLNCSIDAPWVNSLVYTYCLFPALNVHLSVKILQQLTVLINYKLLGCTIEKHKLRPNSPILFLVIRKWSVLHGLTSAHNFLTIQKVSSARIL